MVMIELQLDFSRSRGLPSDPWSFIQWWTTLQKELQPLKFHGPTDRLRIADPTYGDVWLLPVGQGSSPLTLKPASEVAIHGIVEPLSPHACCAVCAKTGKENRAIGQALEVRSEKDVSSVAVCGSHAFFLDGSLQAFLADARPQCRGGGGQATFVCGGPLCRWEGAWSDAFRRQHPRDHDVWYCPECHARLFPTCVGESSECGAIGQYFCEHVDANGDQACGNGICPNHARSWQIFGPEREGIYLCPRHHNALRGDPEAAVRRMVLATAAKYRRAREVDEQGWQDIHLPSLFGFQHTLRKLSSTNTRLQVTTDPGVIRGWVEELNKSIKDDSTLGRAAASLLWNDRKRWERDMQRHQQHIDLAPQMLEQVKAVLPQVLKNAGVVGEYLIAREFREARGEMKAEGQLGTLICTTRNNEYIGLFKSKALDIQRLSRVRLLIKDEPGA